MEANSPPQDLNHHASLLANRVALKICLVLGGSLLPIAVLFMAWTYVSASELAFRGSEHSITQSLRLGDIIHVQNQLHSLIHNSEISAMWISHDNGQDFEPIAHAGRVPDVFDKRTVTWAFDLPRHVYFKQTYPLDLESSLSRGIQLHVITAVPFAPLSLLMLLLGVAMLVIWVLIKQTLYRFSILFGQPLSLALRDIRNLEDGQNVDVEKSSGIAEFDHLRRNFNQLWQVKQQEAELRAQLKVHHAIVQNTQMIAHDVRRPLSMTKLFLSCVKEEAELVNIRKLIAKFDIHIDRSLHEVDKMLEGILSTSQRTPLGTQRFDPEQLVQDAMAQVCPGESEDWYRKQTEFRHSSWLEAERSQTLRVMVNLLSNALEASGEMSRVWVKTEDCETEGSKPMMCITVGNEGSLRQSITLGQPIASSKAKGRDGLGLAIAHRFAVGQRGSLDYRSQAQKTEFFLRLPAVGSSAAFQHHA